MAKRISRVQKTLLSLPVEDRIATVVKAMNGELFSRPHEGRYNTRRLLLLVKRLQAFHEPWSRNPSSFFDDSNPPRVFSRLASEKLEPILRILAWYRAMPSLLFTQPVNKTKTVIYGWEVSWIRMESIEDRFGQHRQVRELIYALDILEIAKAGRINSLKQCEQCHKWLFARFPHQRFCSESCKEHFHRSNEADKKRRREWAKHNYWLHKNKNVK